MLVHQILNAKPSAEIKTIAPGASVKDAASALSSARIGALVVAEDADHPIGIISERDIVRELGRRGPSCLTESISEYMTKKLVSCAPDDTADQVLEKMTNGRFRHMPVMEQEKMVGLISIGDVVKARMSELSMEKDALEGMIMGH